MVSYQKMDTILEECKEEYKNNENWDEIFSKKCDVIEKYMEKYSDTIDNLEEGHLSEYYPSETFQDYVDRHIDFSKIGGYNYQIFCKLMNDKNYRNKIYAKYEKSEKERKMRNHFIYLIEKYHDECNNN